VAISFGNKPEPFFILYMMNNVCLPNTSADHQTPKDSRANPVVLDLARSEIRHDDGRRHELSARQVALLAFLATKAGSPVSRDEILAQVWNLDPRNIFTRTIDMHISALRRKLGDPAQNPVLLVTVHGVGYMLRKNPVFQKGIDSSETNRSSV
jgi:DNA-binding response OmpR family regulator